MATIYIVEDDINIREIERYALKNSGYEVEEFEGSAPFLSVWKKYSVTDPFRYHASGEDGLDILTKIRADKATAEVPVIMVTAKTSELDKVKGLDLGADDYITKPFGVMELISRVKAMLRRTSRVHEDSQLIHEDILMDMDKHAVTVAGQTCELTFKEFELLKYRCSIRESFYQEIRSWIRYGASSMRVRAVPLICISKHCGRNLVQREAVSRPCGMWGT